MASVNKVMLLGNLGKDPEVRHLENGRMRVQLIIATHDTYKTKEGEKVTHTDWHEVVLWTPQAEIAAQHLRKGYQVYVEGKLSHRSYTDKEGQQRYVTQVVGQHLVLLSGQKAKNQGDGIQILSSTSTQRISITEDGMDDLPL